MARFSPEFLDELKTRLRPSDVIADDKAPDFMSKLIRACGAEDADYDDKYN